MCEIFSKKKQLKEGIRTVREEQSEILSPGGAGAFQIKLNKPVNSLLTIVCLFRKKLGCMCRGTQTTNSAF